MAGNEGPEPVNETEPSGLAGSETELPSAESARPRVVVRPRGSFLFSTRLPFWKYVLLMGVISLVPSLLLAGILASAGIVNEQTGPVFKAPEGVPPIVFGASLFLGFLCLSPIVETLLLAFTLWILSFTVERNILRAVFAALIWAGLHSLAAPAWGLVIWWPFFIFSCAYISWRRVSWPHAFLAAGLIHMIQNILPAVAVVASL